MKKKFLIGICLMTFNSVNMTCHFFPNFTKEVDLHYIAATFPKISPEAIARFLKISAQKCYPEAYGPAKHLHVINMRQDLFQTLDHDLREFSNDLGIENKLISVNADNWLVWTPVAS